MAPKDGKREMAREVVDILEEISTLLDCGLDRHQLSICVSLIENNINPEALANAIKDLRSEVSKNIEPEIRPGSSASAS